MNDILKALDRAFGVMLRLTSEQMNGLRKLTQLIRDEKVDLNIACQAVNFVKCVDTHTSISEFMDSLQHLAEDHDSLLAGKLLLLMCETLVEFHRGSRSFDTRYGVTLTSPNPTEYEMLDSLAHVKNLVAELQKKHELAASMGTPATATEH